PERFSAGSARQPTICMLGAKPSLAEIINFREEERSEEKLFAQLFRHYRNHVFGREPSSGSARCGGQARNHVIKAPNLGTFIDLVLPRSYDAVHSLTI